MQHENSVRIDYYSDVLCVWAYLGHVRAAELQKQFSGKLDWHWHYLPVFGDVPGTFLKRWEKRGGVAAYAAHVQEVVAGFDHVTINDATWKEVQPASSAPAHLWLASTRLAVRAGALPKGTEERLAWRLRTAFFEDAIDISRQASLAEVTNNLGLDCDPILSRILDGTAFATLSNDLQTANAANIRVSPTYVFNENRQRLTGNVGYRIIEANVKELLEQPGKQHSWC